MTFGTYFQFALPVLLAFLKDIILEESNMQNLIHTSAFYIHVFIGSLALVIFWLPLLAKKGSRNHVRFGKYFVYGMYAVSISGMLMSSLVLLDPIGLRYPENQFSAEKLVKIAIQQRIFAGFLLMLSVLVFANVKQSILVLKAKKDRQILKKPLNLLTISVLGLLGLLMMYIGFSYQLILFQAFAALCIVNSIGSFRYIYKKKLKEKEWIIAHLGNILGAGIGAYTAFFAFGGRRFFAEIFTGQLQIVPWVLPSVIGIGLITYFSKKFRAQYKVA